MTPHFLSSAGEVLSLFLIPVGGGIPAGVILAKNRGLVWPVTTILYLISDIILACIFEPLMLWFIKAMKHSKFLQNWAAAHKQTLEKLGHKQSLKPGPFALVMVSLGVDPMTGRVAARAAGHGFITGWAIAICGDMIFFAIIMISTLWLDSILGDGTLTAVIIMVAMIVVPMLFRKWRASRTKSVTKSIEAKQSSD
jgi:hypothetical protein